MYTPNPIDTKSINLPAELYILTEQLAENTHNVWAKARMAQGWSYGKVRSDFKKEHPCLVPYSSLPESEKEYDRQTALETLRLIIKLGYTITKED